MKDPANRQELESLPVDLFGFIFYRESPRYAGSVPEKELRKLTDTSREKAAVFVNAPLREVKETVSRYRFEYVQLHGSEMVEYCREIKTSRVKVIKAFHLHPDFSFEEIENYARVADIFLFDTKTARWGGSGEKFNWQLLQKYNLSVPFFLSGGIGPEDAVAVLQFRHPAFCGIDLNSGFEDSPGIKNQEKLKLFLDAIPEKSDPSTKQNSISEKK